MVTSNERHRVNNMNELWSGRKRLLFFGLPWTFTKYQLLNDKFILDAGLLNTTQEEIRLYRIMDITLKRSIIQKIFGLGTIVCNTVDKTSPVLEIVNIKDSQNVKTILSEAVEEERVKKRVSSREFMNDDFDGEDEI